MSTIAQVGLGFALLILLVGIAAAAALVVCAIILMIQDIAKRVRESKELKREKKRAAKHEGKWYVVCDEDTVRRCSNCGSIFRMYKEFFFCPHCGQKKEGVVR